MNNRANKRDLNSINNSNNLNNDELNQNIENLKDDIQVAEQLVKDKETLVKKYKNKVDSLVGKNLKLKEKMKSSKYSKVEKESLRTQIMKREKDIEALKAKLETYTDNYSRLNEYYNSKLQEFNLLMKELVSLNNKNNLHEESNKKLKLETDYLNYLMDLGDRNYFQVLEDIRNLELQYSKEESEIKSLEEKLKKLQIELESKNRNNNDTLEREVECEFYNELIINAKSPYAIFGNIVQPGQLITEDIKSSLTSHYHKLFSCLNSVPSNISSHLASKLLNYYNKLLH